MTISDTQYLRVVGRLHVDGRLQVRPCYLMDHDPFSDADDSLEVSNSVMSVQFCSEDGAVLAAYPLRLYGPSGHATDRIRAVRGYAPFHPETAIVKFLYHGRAIHQIERSVGSPRVRLDWQPQETVEGRHLISWTADHTAGAQLQYFLRFSHTAGRSWNRVSFRTEATEMELDFGLLPGGKRCLVAVVATDGVNTAIQSSTPFSVSIKPCQAIVIAPVQGSVYTLGEPIELIGHGYYLEDSVIESERLTWRSSLDGELGHGRMVTANGLSVGQHHITLTAGHGTREGTEEVAVLVVDRAGAGSAETRRIEA